MSYRYRITKELLAQLSTLTATLDAAKGDLDSVKEDVSSAVNDHREHYDEAPVTWQDSERGQEVSTWLDNWEEVRDKLDELYDNLDDAVTTLNDLEEVP